MKVGIVHGAAINPDGSLQSHTKARADVAIKAYDNSTVDMLVICGKEEADPIASYILNEGIDGEKILIEPQSYSTLSNLYYNKMLLYLLSHVEPINKVYLISNYWHIPRSSFDARKILGKEYRIECISANDPRNEEEIRRDRRLENFKSVLDKMLLNLGYGKEFDRDKFLASVALGIFMITDKFRPVPGSSREVLESSTNLVTPPYQRKLMGLEKMLYKVMRRF